MENRSRGPKLTLILLSVLLITGAVVAAISIDSGKWLTVNPVFAQPADEAVEQNVVAPVTGSSSDLESQQKQSSPSGFGCHHDTAESPEDW